ncbi:uncharacterized protein NECHADRAFT_85665 [Fusarium vanettenii 77-13-4]|uniref:Uncharacterized protein n=1 Tax=Fusarium vanettenii (strain ATCC MYA-4622 / CBS 123669 / FGSC 9596 / NRRL 45880 / 77-13-4) TaxID=660122 RepID=C7ZPB9_FUSV7|nr:uncharacterized protein NECHADRAFT_85665 [Fusarium vanettenii 77-13-4]EEU34325.1 predicted protein [Fusarium vanettenii 77-13-4]
MSPARNTIFSQCDLTIRGGDSWTSWSTATKSRVHQMDLRYAARPPSLDLMSGNTEDMVKTIRYIVDTLEMRHPSKFAVAEEDDEFAHLFSHTTRRFVLRALCTLASAFDALTIAHQRDHNLLEQEDVEPEDGSASSKALYLQPGDTGFLLWNKCVEDFRNEVARAMEVCPEDDEGPSYQPVDHDLFQAWGYQGASCGQALMVRDSS